MRRIHGIYNSRSLYAKYTSVFLKFKRQFKFEVRHFIKNKSSPLFLSASFQVLTANIGTLLDLYGVEKGLDHFRSSQELTFDEFRYYLQHEVFSSLPKAVTLHVVRDYEKKISEVSLVFT